MRKDVKVLVERTHVLGGTAFALGGFLVLRSTNNLIPDVSEVLQLGIIMPYAIWASTLPDLDQEKDTVAQKSPINLVIQKIFKLIGAGHRSVKSHILPAIISIILYFAIAFGFMFASFNGTEISIAGLIFLGLSLGLSSHAVLDMMTYDGLNFGDVTVRFVPKSSTFKAGGMFEMLIRKILYLLDCILIIMIFI